MIFANGGLRIGGRVCYTVQGGILRLSAEKSGLARGFCT